MGDSLPQLAADLTWVHIQGRSYGNLLNWDEDSPPVVGQRVLAVDASDRLVAVVADVWPDGVVVLDFPFRHGQT